MGDQRPPCPLHSSGIQRTETECSWNREGLRQMKLQCRGKRASNGDGRARVAFDFFLEALEAGRNLAFA